MYQGPRERLPMRIASPPPLPRMHGVAFLVTSMPLAVSVLADGQTSPPDTTFSKATATPYWKYSTLLGGGRCDCWADARFANAKRNSDACAAHANEAAFLRYARLRRCALAFAGQAGSTIVVVTGLTVPESFV